MSGLVLSLKPNEKFLVNGSLLMNGPKRGQICIENDDVYVLRLSDVLHPDEINTPVKRVYYAVQLILSGDVKAEDVHKGVEAGLKSLARVFENTPYLSIVEKAEKAVDKARYYSGLCTLKTLLTIEADLFARHMPAPQSASPEMARAG